MISRPALRCALALVVALPISAFAESESTATLQSALPAAPAQEIAADSVSTSPTITAQATPTPEPDAPIDAAPPINGMSFLSDFDMGLTTPLLRIDSPTTLPLGGSMPFDIPQAAPLPIGEIRALLRTGGKGTTRLSPMSAVMAGLAANRELAVQKIRPSISEQGIDSALAEFDPAFRASVSAGESRRSTLSPRGRAAGPDIRPGETISTSRSNDAAAALSARIPTGTNLSVDLGATRDRTNRTRDFYGADASINATQNILRGRGVEFNMARVRIARNDLDISRHQLEAYLINLVSDTLNAYADLYLARETLRIRIESWEVAGAQADQNDEFLRVGRATPLDSLTGRAEQSSRAGDVINAAAALRQRQLALARLIGGIPANHGRNYTADLSLATMPVPAIIPRPPAETVTPAERIRLALTLRPELPQAKLELDNGELEVVRTKNGLLPRLDFTVRAGTSGVGDSLDDAYGGAESYRFGNWQAALELEVPLGNRAARAADRRARFSRDLAEAALANQRQQIELDIRSALIEVERAQRLILTTEVARRQREQSLFNERQRLSVGSGTRLEVIQAERDLIQAQIDQVSAQIGLAKAFIELHRAEGSTLVRTGVSPYVVSTIAGNQSAPKGSNR